MRLPIDIYHNSQSPHLKKKTFYLLRPRMATSVFLCTRRPCGRSGSRHAQNGFQLKMRLRCLDKRFWWGVSTKANNESERPKKKNEMHSILYLFDLFCEVYVLLYLQMQLRIVELYLVLLVSFLELLGEWFYKERDSDSVPEFSTYQRQG